MPPLKEHSNPEKPIWVVIEKPYPQDKYTLLDGGYGFVFHAIMKEANLADSYFITALKEDLALEYDNEAALLDFCNKANRYRPPFLIILGEVPTGLLLPQSRSFKKPFKARVESFAGSLLSSPSLSYEHYAVCTHPPDFIVGNWSYRDIQLFLDIGRVREELDYYQKNGKHNPLPSYELVVAPSFPDLMNILYDFNTATYLSTDIETIRPRQKSTTQFKGNPGFPYLMGMADSSKRGLSFSLWNYSEEQSITIWRQMDLLLRTVPQIGQNYFNFDANYIRAVGLQCCLGRSQDTLIRHSILWPELPHSLQFLTKQYTRQPYYKDEGKGFVPKNQNALTRYMEYNSMDCVVTYAVYEGQEAEFAARPYLK